MEANEIEFQDESVREFQRTHPPTPTTRKKSIARASEKTEMTRGRQTAWIVGTMIVLGLGGLYFATRMDPTERDAKCQTLFGMDRECVVENAAARLRGYELPAGEVTGPVDPLDPLASVVPDLSTTEDAGGAAGVAVDTAPTEAGRTATADSELEMGSRQAVELNEMICRETGQNCEVAKMARRHHIERYGRF